jgi:hypothetical protein
MQPHERDDAIRRERPHGVPTDITADEPPTALPGGSVPEVDVRVKGPGCWRPLLFATVGPASGFSLAQLCSFGCNSSMGPATTGPEIMRQNYAHIFEGCCLIVATVGGGCIGFIVGLLWSPKRHWSRRSE